MTKVEMTLPEVGKNRYYYHPTGREVYVLVYINNLWAAWDLAGGGPWAGWTGSADDATSELLPCPPGTVITTTVGGRQNDES